MVDYNYTEKTIKVYTIVARNSNLKQYAVRVQLDSADEFLNEDEIQSIADYIVFRSSFEERFLYTTPIYTYDQIMCSIRYK